MKNWFWLGLILLFSGSVAAQTNKSSDSLGKKTSPVVAGDTVLIGDLDSLKKVKNKKFMPVPKTATRLALIPGAGQIYNRDYWKLPIVYIAFGGGLYTYYLNSLKYHDYLSAYKSFYVLDKNDPKYGELKPGLTDDSAKIVRVRNLLNTSSQYLPATKDRIVKGKNYWRRNRGFALVVTGLIYTLSIIEANVAAHLKTFDLSDDLTLRVEPKMSQPSMRTPTPGLRLVFNIR
ncbi:DUF5683 domain-containing protein [Dyadobacter sp. MSC1_007]|uniref:DUF5683 domain-containing protein n=1 Tax=Dyadobacter sp. MSC1_007 TaxID=2909264 RepID=UPI00202EF2AD|nr:DUF5683 domain-containing protein [Dyadobacter sp. MSC1_007]